MKNFLLSLTAMVWSIVLAAQSKDELAVRKMLLDQVDAWNHGSIENFMKGYWENDSLIFVGHGGITYGYAETLRHYKKAYSDSAKMGKLFFELIRLKRLSAGYFFVTGRFFLKRTGGDLSGYFTLLVRRIGDQWRIVEDHTG
jgi:hypothetical protein